MSEAQIKDNSDDETDSLDIYKYRKRKDQYELFMEPSIPTNSYDVEKPTKTYAILQESRAEFTNNKLKYAMLIYSNYIWQLVILAVIISTYILETWLYTFCKFEERDKWIIIFIVCLNLIFTFDVVILFCLKFIKKWRRTLNLVEPETARVILDVVISMPFALLYFLDLRVFGFDLCFIAPSIAGIRVYRVILYFYTKSSQAGRNQWTTFLFQYLILFLLAVHTLTCVWYQFAYRGFEVKKLRSSWTAAAVQLPIASVTDWYFVCVYWSIMIITTNALGDIYPITTAERITAIVAIIIGFLLTTIVFVGSLTSQFITITTRRSKYVRQLRKIQNHLKLINMDESTTQRIIRYYEDLWYQKSGVFKPKLMDLLPYPLRMEICYDLNAVPLYSSLIFRKLPEPFLRRLSLAMTHQFYLPGDIVCNQNQTKTIMICITNGVLELLSDEDDESPMISFTKGSCLGEVSLVYNIPDRDRRPSSSTSCSSEGSYQHSVYHGYNNFSGDEAETLNSQSRSETPTPQLRSAVNTVITDVAATASPVQELPPEPVAVVNSNQPSTSALPPEILSILGEAKKLEQPLGEDIPTELSERWGKILLDGLENEQKQLLLEKMLIPNNFILAQAPKLNQEIAAVLNDSTKNRDKRLETSQNQLGVGIAGLANLTKYLIKGELTKLEILTRISEISQILLDLHNEGTINRKNLLLPHLDKQFWNAIQGAKRDNYLFSEKLGENIKNTKEIAKSGQEIKRSFPAQQRKQQAMSGNYRAPPRQYTARPPPPAARSRPLEHPPARRKPSQPQRRTRPYQQRHNDRKRR